MSKSKIILPGIAAIGGGLLVLIVWLKLTSAAPGLIVHAINQRTDTDVTASTNYNFSSFAGTIWKTKIRTAIAEFKNYKGKQSVDLLPPSCFDTNDPSYTMVYPTRMVGFLPVGTRIRIERLMEDHGVRGGVDVFGTVLDGTNAQTQVLLGPDFFAPNRFLRGGPQSPTNWSVNTNEFEAL